MKNYNGVCGENNIYLPLIDHRCHGNEIWDKMGHNSAHLKDNCVLFAPTPIFGPGLFNGVI